MTPEENKTLIRRLVDEVWNPGNAAAAAEFYAPDFMNHDPAVPGVRNLQDFASWFTQLRTAMPDFHVDTGILIAEGDLVAKQWVARGTHMAEYLGVPATGAPVELQGITFYRIANGKIVECWWAYDPKELGTRHRVTTQPELAATK